VGDVREMGLDREPPPTVYWCTGAMQPGTFFLLRVLAEPGFLAGTIRRKIHELEPSRSVYDLTSLTAHISDAYADNRLRTILLAFFAVTAIALASIGLYGTLSYLVHLRRREVALRIALGALRVDVVRQFVDQGLRVASCGCVVGLALAAAFARMLSSMLFGVSATDVVTLGGVVFIVLAVSVMASLAPAIRAARFEPMRALREEWLPGIVSRRRYHRPITRRLSDRNALTLLTIATFFGLASTSLCQTPTPFIIRDVRLF
jgi:predicted lysophospholipase L1 biosynthesis ABC-type transport system permease subunit